MNRLIIFTGACGSGKSFCLRAWIKLDDNAQIIKSFVSNNRTPREKEITMGYSDCIFARCYDPETEVGKEWYKKTYPSLPLPIDLCYHDHEYNCSSLDNDAIYEYHGSYYEVDKNGINFALKNGKNPIVIVRKSETIQKLIKIYNNALLIYVQSILSGEDLVKKLVALGESEDDARKIKSQNAEDLKDYIASINKMPANNTSTILNDYNEIESGATFTQLKDIYVEQIQNYQFKVLDIASRNMWHASLNHIAKCTFNYGSYDKEGLFHNSSK